jgi:uncharacterized protein
MRVVLDTNILISAAIAPDGVTGAIIRAWRHKLFAVLTCEAQIDELRRCFARPHLVPKYLTRQEAGQLVNVVRRLAVFVERLPAVQRSADPDDNFLLGLAEAGLADYLISGDKDGLLALRSHAGTAIVTPRVFTTRLGLL